MPPWSGAGPVFCWVGSWGKAGSKVVSRAAAASQQVVSRACRVLCLGQQASRTPPFTWLCHPQEETAWVGAELLTSHPPAPATAKQWLEQVGAAAIECHGISPPGPQPARVATTAATQSLQAGMQPCSPGRWLPRLLVCLPVVTRRPALQPATIGMPPSCNCAAYPDEQPSPFPFIQGS